MLNKIFRSVTHNTLYSMQSMISNVFKRIKSCKNVTYAFIHAMTKLALTARPYCCGCSVPVTCRNNISLLLLSFTAVLFHPSSSSRLSASYPKKILYLPVVILCNMFNVLFRTNYNSAAIKTLTPEQTALFDLLSTNIIFCGEKGLPWKLFFCPYECVVT